MSQTLRTTFSVKQHHSARRALVPASSVAASQTLEGMLAAMHSFLAKAKADLLQPRQKAIDRILQEAALLH